MRRHRAPGTSISYKSKKTGSLGNRTSLGNHNLGRGGSGNKSFGPGIMVVIGLTVMLFGWFRGCTA